MGDLAHVKSEIAKLTADEEKELRAWLAERHNDAWDAKLAADVAAGKLDVLVAEAESEIAAGKVRDL
jgi:hypothetical protein